jgi:hypothetical protein
METTLEPVLGREEVREAPDVLVEVLHEVIRRDGCAAGLQGVLCDVLDVDSRVHLSQAFAERRHCIQRASKRAHQIKMQ